MQLSSTKVLITGGAGGIGRAIAEELLVHGAAVLLVDLDSRALEASQAALGRHAHCLAAMAADLTSRTDLARVCAEAQHWRGGVNVLINAAGLNHFRLLEEQPAEQVDSAFAVNVQAPIHLCRMLLPHLRAQPKASILNIGSVFGAIGYPGYVTYSATKFALRGFSQALRRELAGTAIGVHYLAPRATRTAINPPAVVRMNEELGVAMDPPARVARAVRVMLENEESEAVVGWPEKLFVRVNALLPRLVDGAIRRQLPVIRHHAGAAAVAHGKTESPALPENLERHPT